MKIVPRLLIVLSFALVPISLTGAQEMKRVFEEMKTKQNFKKYRVDGVTETPHPPTQSVQESQPQKAPDRPARPPELQQNLEQPIPTPKLIKYSKPSGRIPVPSLIINSGNQTAEGKQLFDEGIKFLRESYTSAESADLRRKKRDCAIDYLEQSFIKDPHTKVLAAFFLIYFTTRLPGVKIPENPYFMGAVHYEGKTLIDKFPDVKKDIEGLAELSKKST